MRYIGGYSCLSKRGGARIGVPGWLDTFKSDESVGFVSVRMSVYERKERQVKIRNAIVGGASAFPLRLGFTLFGAAGAHVTTHEEK